MREAVLKRACLLLTLTVAAWVVVQSTADATRNSTYPTVVYTLNGSKYALRMVRWERKGDDLLILGKERVLTGRAGDEPWHDTVLMAFGYFNLPSYKAWPEDSFVRALGDANLLPATDVEAGRKPDSVSRRTADATKPTATKPAARALSIDDRTFVRIALAYASERSLDALAEALDRLTGGERP